MALADSDVLLSLFCFPLTKTSTNHLTSSEGTKQLLYNDVLYGSFMEGHVGGKNTLNNYMCYRNETTSQQLYCSNSDFKI